MKINFGEEEECEKDFQLDDDDADVSFQKWKAKRYIFGCLKAIGGACYKSF